MCERVFRISGRFSFEMRTTTGNCVVYLLIESVVKTF